MADTVENPSMENFLSVDRTTPEVPSENPDAGQADTGADAAAAASAAPPPKNVPIQALDEERGRRREMESELSRLRDTNARMEQRFQDFLARVAESNQRQMPQQQLPDFDTMPADHLKAKVEQLEQALGSTLQQQQMSIQQQQAAAQQQAYQQQLQMRVATAEREFVAATPDYMQALDYVRQGRLKELQTFLPPDAALMALQGEEQGFINACVQQGVNPAERAYQMAQLRGFKAAAPVVDGKLKAVQAGQEANKSLGATGGGQTKPVPTSLEDLAHLDGAEFDRAFDLLMSKNQGTFGGILN